MKKIKRQFRENLVEYIKQSKELKAIVKKNWYDENFLNTLAVDERMIIISMRNWFNEPTIANRKLFHIKTNNREFINFLEKVSSDLMEVLTKQLDIDYQVNVFKEYFKEEYWEMNTERTLCIEFDEEVSFDNISASENKFTELVLTQEGFITFNGNTGMTSVSTNHGFSTIMFALLFTNKLTEFVSEDDDGVHKQKINKEFKIEKRSFKKNKITSLWNYGTISFSSEKLTSKTKRPIDFDKREEVILTRKPHYRKLRNGEVRFFTGIEAKYYKLKDIDKIGTITHI